MRKVVSFLALLLCALATAAPNCGDRSVQPPVDASAVDGQATDDAAAQICGNGIIEQGEDCDGDPGSTCADLGHTDGTLRCEDCQLKGCYSCGNGFCEAHNGESRFNCPTDCVSRVIDAGEIHTCGLIDGEAYCWGHNVVGQLGDGLSHDSCSNNQDCSSVPGPIAFNDDTSALAIGGGHNCLIASDGRVYCWGNNFYHQVGAGALSDVQTIPVEVPGLTDAIAIAAGSVHTCAIRSDQTVWCWGVNYCGILGDGVDTHLACGDGTADCSIDPVQVSGLTDVVDLSLGFDYSCAVKSDGTIWCWGCNFQGQLGVDPMMDGPEFCLDGIQDPCSRLPYQVPGVSNIVQVSSGLWHACARTGAGEVWCWGDNQQGQHGDGDAQVMYYPSQAVGISQAVDITAGGFHSCAAISDGTASCWGEDNDGQLGGGSGFYTFWPLQVASPVSFDSISAGWSHTCALASDGSAWCWGYGEYGQIGNGAYLNEPRPVQVGPPF